MNDKRQLERAQTVLEIRLYNELVFYQLATMDNIDIDKQMKMHGWTDKYREVLEDIVSEIVIEEIGDE